MKSTASSTEQSPQSHRGRATPYRLVVFAPDTANAVSAAGGLIADTLRAGWHVEVYLEAGSDARALRILGADGRPLPDSFDFELKWPDAIVFASSTYERHRSVRRLITDATRHHGADVAAWGGTWPMADASASEIKHRLSGAARAFKYHAMKAVGTAAPSAPVEEFYGGFHRLVTVPG